MVMQLNSPSMFDAFPTIDFGVPPRLWWILGAKMYWTMDVPGARVTMAMMVLALMPPARWESTSLPLPKA